jgi:hypothetical protein
MGAEMTHPVDGFDLKFTSRRSWKAERRQRGHLIDVVPVAWTKGRRVDDGGRIFQEVWYHDRGELEARANDPTPFVVALALAHDYAVQPLAFRHFVGIFEVAATGKILSDISIETEIRRRVQAQ